MSKFLGSNQRYEQVRREARSRPSSIAMRGPLAVAAGDLPSDVMRDIDAARLRRQMYEAIQRNEWSPFDRDLFGER